MNEIDQLHVLMLSTEYRLHRVGGLGAAVVALTPRLADRASVDLVVPRYNAKGRASEPLGRFGRLHRVDAERPQNGDDFDQQVWRMNDRLNEYVTGLIEGGAAFDVLHVHDWLGGYAANDLHRRYGLPLVVTFHATEHGRMAGHIYSSQLSQRIHLAEKHLAQKADRIIACSEFMRRQIAETLDAPIAKIDMIPNGVDADAYAGLRERRPQLLAERAAWAIEGGPLIFFVGRLVWEKGPDLLAAAMPDVVREFPTARAIIAGRGPMDEHLARLVDDLGMQEHVLLPGFIEDETRDMLYALADAAVFPSRYEPFGIVALEAMAAGVPVIVAGGSGLGEVVTNEVTGLCVTPGRADSVAEGVLRVLRDKAAAQDRAARAEVVVREQYSWDRVAGLTLRVYETLSEA